MMSLIEQPRWALWRYEQTCEFEGCNCRVVGGRESESLFHLSCGIIM
jgi:hypothetical protein